jgi:putative oxidoreductase
LSFLNSGRGLAPLVLRVVTGLIMFMHGWQKWQGGHAGVAGFFGSLGIPQPELMAWVVMFVEVVCGLFLVLGLFTRLSAILVAAVVITVLFTAKAGGSITGGDGPTMELEMSLAAAAISLALLGPGRLSIDRRLGLAAE